MVKTILFTKDEIRKVIDANKGILVIHDSLEDFGDQIEIHFSSCGFLNTSPGDMFGVSEHYKYEDHPTVDFYHYDSLEEIESEYPKATLFHIHGISF